MVLVKEKVIATPTKLCYFGHHKCGTQWIQSIVRQLCQHVGLNHGHAYSDNKFKNGLTNYLEAKQIDVFSYTNAHYKYVEELVNFRGFHVVRDPRDIAISAYFSHLYSHPTENNEQLEEERRILETLTLEEGLLQEIEFNAPVFQAMKNWDYTNENILEVKMEELTKDAYGGFLDIFRFLGLVGEEERLAIGEQWNYLLNLTSQKFQQAAFKKTLVLFKLQTLPYEKALAIVYENSFKRKTKGRVHGQEDVKSHYRKGVAGDWKNYFQPDHIKLFKEQYGELLIKLGYEKDYNWSR